MSKIEWNYPIYKEMKKGDKIRFRGKTGTLLTTPEYKVDRRSGLFYADVIWNNRRKQKGMMICRRGLEWKPKSSKISKLTQKERKLLRYIRTTSFLKGATTRKELDLKEDIHGRVIGGKDKEVLSSLIRKGEVYVPREGYYKPTNYNSIQVGKKKRIPRGISYV